MGGANGMLLIVVGLLILWIMIGNKGACAGGFVDCMTRKG